MRPISAGPSQNLFDQFFRLLVGASQASVPALSMKCSSLLLHCGQANVLKCWPHMLGSITANLMGEPQAAHCGPWFCLSSMRYPYVWREATFRIDA